jgi:dihydroorotase
MSRTLIRRATCVFPTEILKTDLLLDDGRIAMIDPARHARADEVILAAGLHVLPGLIDDQVHFREPGLTHKEDLRTGSMACAKGGVTTFLEMPNTKPATTTRALLEDKLALAAGQCLVNYGFYMGATGANLEELKLATRTPGIKIFIGSSTGDLLVDDQAALESIFAETRLPITAHCEDETRVRENAARLGGGRRVADHSLIRDAEAAAISARRAFELAVRHRHRFHLLHTSTALEVELLREWKSPLLTAEACPHHLFFSVDDYERLGSRIQMNPSVKSPADVTALWQALADGTIQVIATDHATHTLEEKAKPYPESPSGLPAVENSLALMLDQVARGKVGLGQLAHWMSDAPARVWGIVGKGRIAEGYDADLVLVDLEKAAAVRDEEQVTKSRWSPWHGQTHQGWPVRTLVGGRTVFAEGRFDLEARGAEARFDPERGGYWATG